MSTAFLCVNVDNSPAHRKITRIANKISKAKRKERKASAVIVYNGQGEVIQVGNIRKDDVLKQIKSLEATLSNIKA